MNSRIEKLYQHDPVWKFWQPNAKLEKIHPPVYWKPLNAKPIHSKKKTNVINHKRSCSNGCNYTTLIYKQDCRIYIDFEHDGLQHATWKELIEKEHLSNDKLKVKDQVEFPWLNLNNKQQRLNGQYLKRQELARYFKSHIQKDNLFKLDKTSYVNQSIPMSRRPRDALHIDFYQATCFEGSKTEATFKTFYHRKYLLPRHLREYTLKDLLTIAPNAQLDIEIIGHFILHPNELSKHEIKMFELTSEFGEIYEGHIIRINKQKLVLLLASADYSDIKLAQPNELKTMNENPQSPIEQIVLDHVRKYLQTNNDYSIEQIRRMQIELEPLITTDKRRVIVHLLTNEEILKTLSFEITYEQEPKLFDIKYQQNLYFLQNINEQTMITSVEDQLKQLLDKRYSLKHKNSYLELTLDALNSLQKMFYAYANHTLTKYSREECMGIAIEYSFDDLLDKLDSNEGQSINDKEIQMMIDDVQMRLRLQIERRLEAENTARILLVGPPMKKEIKSIENEVVVLDHHREIFITRSDSYTGPSKMKNLQRNNGHVIFHEEIDGGPKSYDRLPMSIDSLTILTRIQQRKRLAMEQNDNNLIQLGSGIHRVITSEDHQQNISFSVECEQDKIDKKSSTHISLDEEDDKSIKTLHTTSINTKSYNTSAHSKQEYMKKFYRANQQRKKKRITRSFAEYGKHKQKRRKHKRYEPTSEIFINSINPKHLFLENLFLLRRNRKQTHAKTSKAININATTEENYVLNDKSESVEHQQMQDEEMHDDNNPSENSFETESYLQSLYGSLSSSMTHAQDIYQSKPSRLMYSLDLAHIFITFLHIRKDIAYEIASTIIDARQRLIRHIPTQKSSSNAIIDEKLISNEQNDIDDASISSGIVTGDESDTIVTENSNASRSISDDDEDQNNMTDVIKRNKYNLYENKHIDPSKSQHMSRITKYLSEADWRVFNYITKHFLQDGAMITIHALEFSSALLMDLIEDSVYQTYFHSKWCSDSSLNIKYIEHTFIEEFFKKSINNLFNHLQLINSLLLENIALMHTLKKYMSTTLLQNLYSMECYPVPIGRDPCIWFSADILIKTICSLTDDILKQMNHDYLSDYTKFEYLLISYFRKIKIVHNLQDIIEKNQREIASRSSSTISNFKCLLHVIDLNQAPKFFSDQAFKRFKFGEHSDLNGDIEALKDLVLLDIQKRNVKSVKRPYIPLKINDLVTQQQNRVLTPSPSILAQLNRRWGGQKLSSSEYSLRKDTYKFDETTDSTKIDNLPPEVRAVLENMIQQYGTIEENLGMKATQDLYEGLSEEEVAQLIENAIDAVERFDRENNIGDRKLQNKKTVNDRLTEFFKYAGRHGVRVLDDVLQLAKLRSNDPKKYLPLAVNMLKDRLKQSGKIRQRKQPVRFAHTLESLLVATDNQPEWITTMLKKNPAKKSSNISKYSSKPSITEIDSVQRITEEVDKKIDNSSTEPVSSSNIELYPMTISVADKHRQTLPIIDEEVEPTISLIDTVKIGSEFDHEQLISSTIISHIGLTVAQLVVLITGQNQEPLKLTNTQIEQICLKQGVPTEQLQVYIKQLMQTTKIPDKFKLTEEQLIQIAIEENISIADVEHIETSEDNLHLSESQIQSLIAQINMVNRSSLTSTLSSKQQQLQLVLNRDQLIELGNQQKINIDKLLDNEIALQNSSPDISSKIKFTLSPIQIGRLINQNNLDIRKLKVIEQNLKKQSIETQQFRLTSSQIAYLYANHRTVHRYEVTDLPADTESLEHDDDLIMKTIKNTKYEDLKGQTQEILPITTSPLELVENTQDKNLLETIRQLETDIGRSLTEQEISMVANGDITGLEKSLSSETIKSMYNNRFTNLTDESNRNLTDKEMRDILSRKSSGIENSLDLTASQLTNPPSIGATVKELEDVLEHRLKLPESQYMTDQQINDPETIKDDFTEDSSVLGRISRRPIYFTLSEIEKAIGKPLDSDELKRFADSRFTQIEDDLGKSLTDLQRSNLLKGDKLTVESLIGRKLSPEETGPHIVDITAIEKILNRSLTFDELISLAGDRFDEIRSILQRPFTQEELIDLLKGNYDNIIKLIEEELDKQKEKEIKEPPINRIQYFEKILHRKLSPHELLRFAEDRFQPLTHLLSDVMKPEQILDLSSNRYDKIQTFFNRQLTSKEKWELEKSILQVHMKYSNTLEEIEYIIQRRLNEQELRNLVDNQYHEIETRLGKPLTEKQLRNILQGKTDQSLNGVDDLLNRFKRKYEDDYKRTRVIANRLIEKIDQDYKEDEKELTVAENLKPSSSATSIQKKQSGIEFHQSTTDLLEQLSDDVRKHAIVTQQDSLLNAYSSEIMDEKNVLSSGELKNQERLKPDKEMISSSVPLSPAFPTEPIKAFENISRIVEHIADEEHIEEITTLNNIINQFQEKPSKDVKKSISNQTTSSWLSNLNKDITSPHLPAIKSIDNKPTIREPSPTQSRTDEDIYLGWTLFKGADRPDLGLKEEKPCMINVKHIPQTYVIGIPEEYADAKSKTIANKIYRGENIHYRYPKSRIIKEMGEFVSQLFDLPLINDATHFIVPSRAYIDLSEPMDTYKSEMINIEDDDLQMCDSPETLEWYEECIQRNIQVHAQIPTGYQPSIVYCHTGRRTIITPAKRAEQRKAILAESTEKFKTMLVQPESKIIEDISPFCTDFIERLNQPMFDIRSTDSTSTARTVTDLILHTVTSSKKTDLLEALEELFSQENLDKYQMTETHWQDIFLILLNSYLHSHSLNRKDIFKRLTDKLHELRKNEYRRSSGVYPSISIASPTLSDTIKSLDEYDKKQFRFGLRSSVESMNSEYSPNDSEHSPTLDQQSIVLPFDDNPSTQSLSQNHSAVSTSYNLIYKKSSQINMNEVNLNSIEHINKRPADAKQHRSINSNAMTEHHVSLAPRKNRQYKITIMHSDEPLDISSDKCKTVTESIKLPPIVSRDRTSKSKQSASTAKRIRTKVLSKF